MATLDAVQQRYYTFTCNIYRYPSTVVARDVPCYFWTETSRPMVQVLTQTQNVTKETPDKVAMHIDEDLQTGDVVKQVSGGKRDGRMWEVRGEPRVNEPAHEQTAELTDVKRSAAWMT